MNAAAATVIGTAVGFAGLGLTALWMRGVCLPVSAHEAKWQCDAAIVGVALVYFGSSLLTAILANRHKIPSAVLASFALFALHAWTPYFAITFFGEHWYQNWYALVLAAAPALAGMLVGMLLHRGKHAHAL